MVSGAARQGAADLEMLRAVFAHKPDAWAVFVRQCQGDVYAACRIAFPDSEANDVFVQTITQLRADDFALLRAFDGRATIAGYLRLTLRDLLAARIARLLSENPERGWRAFEHFFKRDLLRIIARYFPAAGDDDDIYHDVVSALIEDNYRRILAYDGQGSFGGFVLRIVNNLCIDRLRKDVPRRRLPAAIQRLPAAEQEVFKQLYWEKCPEHQLGAALRACKIELGAEAIATAVVAVRTALPRNFSADDEDARPRLVALPGSTGERSSESELPDDRPSPEDAVIASEDEATLEQATGALKAAIARLPQEIRLYLQHVMSGDGQLPARDIAKLMARPVTEIYRLRQQAERMLSQALSENSAVKNLRMSV